MYLRNDTVFSDRGASEVLGAVMLISVVVMAVAIVGVMLTSQSSPQKIPAVSAVISESGSIVQIYHDGGDSLQKSEFVIQVDGHEVPVSMSGNTNWQTWSIGETLLYSSSSTPAPERVQVVYTGGGSGAKTILASAEFSTGVSSVSPPEHRPRTITASAGSGGAISPSGAVDVAYGSSQSFTISPNTGYHIADVRVDGSSVGAITGYTFPNVVTGHTISASFASSSYTITASAGTGGSISPSGSVSVPHGNTQAFTISADSGYYISAVTVDGVSRGSVTSYTFDPVIANHDIVVTFTRYTFTIIPSVSGSGGSISPDTPQTVNYGDTPVFTFFPNTGYHLATVTVNGTAVTPSGNTYTFPAVTGDHTITGMFATERTQFYYQGFESWTGGWIGGTRRTDSVPKNGTASMLISGSNNMYRTISTAGYSDIIVQFAWAGITNKAGQNVYAEYSTDGGSSYSLLAQLTGPVDQRTLTTVTSAVLPATANNQPDFRLRFRITGNNINFDVAYIDDVNLTGIPV